jgi:hypothetical protein
LSYFIPKMVKKRKLSNKQKKEMALVIGSVLLVAVIGLITTSLAEDRVSTIAGAAIKLNPDVPTYAGEILLLKNYCGPVTGEGNCNAVCGEKTCIPVEESCIDDPENNQCFCCESVQ